MHHVCVCGPPMPVGFPFRGCVRDRSGAFYFPYMCVDKVLAVVNIAYESSLSKLCKRLHQGLEEGGVVGPRGGVGLGVEDFSYSPASLDLGSCGGYSLCEMALRFLEGAARVADGDGHEFHSSPHRI